MDTKQGYLVLQVLERYEAGEQPLNKVENEITDHLYSGRMEPAMRNYLKTLREQSYVVIKPGYQEIAGGGNSEIQEVSATPEASKNKKGHKEVSLIRKEVGLRPMKTSYVTDLLSEQSITSFFLVHEKEPAQHARGARLSSP